MIFQKEQLLDRSQEEVFDFLICPHRVIQLTPPEMNMTLTEAPQTMQIGSEIHLQGRRWGVTSRAVHEVILLQRPELIVVEQRKGPFAKWKHTQEIHRTENGTRLVDVIEFQKPSGMLGLMLTESRILSDLETIFAYRQERLQELF